MNKKASSYYNLVQVCSSLFMIVALLWLTISAPFVFRAQQAQLKYQKEISKNLPADNTEEANPLTNTTEEKTPPTISISEEYIHHTDVNEHPWFSISNHHRDFAAATYIAYHGELFSPPPNA